jgi:hypothetical protein
VGRSSAKRIRMGWDAVSIKSIFCLFFYKDIK